ncbi:MAG: 2-C-methyl-D-erythritol 4-phosphate cytidylyltransferase [Firmicutes bacterium]|nr:2-C-methyl-D-erythritol 4-phosphate cytidylyltransferase [Bacillota bacterium]
MNRISAIIAAAGSGSRMGGSVPKQYMMLGGLPMIAQTVRAFCGIKEIEEIVVVCPPGDTAFCQDLLAQHLHACTSGVGVFPKVLVREGADTRQRSVLRGLDALSDPELVLVHDGARPFVSEAVIRRVIDALKAGADAVSACVRPKNTIRTEEGTLDRDSLFEVQTPQGFKAEVLRAALLKAEEDGFTGTDDAGLAERLGTRVVITEGSYDNIKITTPEDMPMITRSGIGYDVHRLVPGRKLMLGCVEVPYEKGLLGHSDADVCAHAIADALLGAAGLRDIGYWFPDTSADTEGMSGALLLAKTAEIVRNAGFTISNADATIVAQRPKLSEYIDAMRFAVAEALDVPPSCVGIKATTEEGLGVTGDGGAISCFAAASIR